MRFDERRALCGRGARPTLLRTRAVLAASWSAGAARSSPSYARSSTFTRPREFRLREPQWSDAIACRAAGEPLSNRCLTAILRPSHRHWLPRTVPSSAWNGAARCLAPQSSPTSSPPRSKASTTAPSPTATGANDDLPTIGSVRLVLGAQARLAHRSERPGRLHRHLHGHLRAGSSTNIPTGSRPRTSCRSPAASPGPLRPGSSAIFNQLCPGRGQQASRTPRSARGMIRTILAIPIADQTSASRTRIGRW